MSAEAMGVVLRFPERARDEEHPLSPDEAMGLEGAYSREQREEDLLYFDLEQCRVLRCSMTRMDTWSDEFLFAKIERAQWVESARNRLVRVRARGRGLPGLIAEMCLAEGV